MRKTKLGVHITIIVSSLRPKPCIYWSITSQLDEYIYCSAPITSKTLD